MNFKKFWMFLVPFRAFSLDIQEGLAISGLSLDAPMTKGLKLSQKDFEIHLPALACSFKFCSQIGDVYLTSLTNFESVSGALGKATQDHETLFAGSGFYVRLKTFEMLGNHYGEYWTPQGEMGESFLTAQTGNRLQGQFAFPLASSLIMSLGAQIHRGKKFFLMDPNPETIQDEMKANQEFFSETRLFSHFKFFNQTELIDMTFNLNYEYATENQALWMGSTFGQVEHNPWIYWTFGAYLRLPFKDLMVDQSFSEITLGTLILKKQPRLSLIARLANHYSLWGASVHLHLVTVDWFSKTIFPFEQNDHQFPAQIHQIIQLRWSANL
jgi:hypothetical protein